MKESLDNRDKQIRNQTAALKREISNLKEQYKILQKRLDFTQDELTKNIIQERAIVQAVSYIVEIGKKIAERNKIEHAMGLPPPTAQPSTSTVPEGAKSEPEKGLYS